MMVKNVLPMQSLPVFAYLYIVKAMTLLLLTVWLCALPSTAADNIYAVVISGGRGKLYNHERYWNDCAFLYRTLRHVYGLPGEHVTLLMADGDDPATDTLLEGAGGLVSQPTDLDGDGSADLHLAATAANVSQLFDRLATTLTADDHLFVYIIGHGERTPHGDVHLWLWNNEWMDAAELSALLDRCHPATMNIVLGLCYGGAFADQLRGERRIITAACAADQLSWACADRPYDEFVYHWTCAIAGHDEQGRGVDADLDADGRVSMSEAYHYACSHDRRPETPCLLSWPEDQAHRWSFSGMGDGSAVRSITTDDDKTPIYDLQGRMVKNP